ncbi:MAG: Lrp/AsnC ligand binding domain-containing protein [Candidatus Omnitrophica bacterium]|nr:Lrp/AsnC ligand binding domain-containing protein [Candidatus Omnitrophota bacterium]
MPKAFVMIDVHPGKEDHVEEAVRQMAGVHSVYQVTGEFDMIAFIEAEPYHAFARLVDTIRKAEGVRDTDTQLVLEKT